MATRSGVKDRPFESLEAAMIGSAVGPTPALRLMASKSSTVRDVVTARLIRVSLRPSGTRALITVLTRASSDSVSATKHERGGICTIPRLRSRCPAEVMVGLVCQCVGRHTHTLSANASFAVPLLPST